MSTPTVHHCTDPLSCTICSPVAGATFAGAPETWEPMDSAPRNATWVIGQLGDDREVRMHYAEGGGEEQPPFRGWFEAVTAADGRVLFYRGVIPLQWRPERPSPLTVHGPPQDVAVQALTPPSCALPGAGEATTEPEDTIRMVERVVRACSSGTHREFGAAYDALLTRLRATAAALTRSEAAREEAERRREEADIRADSLLHLPAALATAERETAAMLEALGISKDDDGEGYWVLGKLMAIQCDTLLEACHEAVHAPSREWYQHVEKSRGKA